MEEIGEKFSGNSQIQNLIQFSEFSNFLQCSEASISKYVKNLKKINTKVVVFHFLYKFYVGQISSAVQISSESQPENQQISGSH